jgi:hypothetical protein
MRLFTVVMKQHAYILLMEQHAFKNVNNGLNTNISSYLETSVVKVLIYN